MVDRRLRAVILSATVTVCFSTVVSCSPQSPIEGIEFVDQFDQGEQLNCDEDASRFIRFRATRKIALSDKQLADMFGWNGSSGLHFPEGTTNGFAGSVRMDDGSIRRYGELCMGNLVAEGGGGFKKVESENMLFEGQEFVAPAAISP